MRRLGELIGVQEGEGRKLARLIAFAFLYTSGTVVAKAAQRGIFLAVYPRSRIPDAFVISALVLATTAFLVSGIADRLGIVRLLQSLLVGAGLTLVGMRALLSRQVGMAAFATYVAIEVINGVLTVQAWTFISAAMDIREAKRLGPLVGLGTGFAWTLGGWGSNALSQALGAESLLITAGVLFAGALTMTGLIARLDWTHGGSNKKRQSLLTQLSSGFRFIRENSLLRVLTAVAVFDILIEQICDFQLLASAQARYVTQEAITAFNGRMFACIGVASLIVPIALSGRVLTRFGSARSLLLANVWELGLSFAFLIHPAFGLVVALSAGDRVLKQSLSAPARGQIQGALPPVGRAQASAVSRGVIAPLFYALGGAALKAVPTSVPVRWLSAPNLALIGVLSVLTLRWLRATYLQSLQRAVGPGQLDLEEGFVHVELDPERLHALEEEIRSGEDDRIEVAVSVLASTPTPAARALLLSATRSPASSVRLTAFRALARSATDVEVEAFAGAARWDEDRVIREICFVELRQLSAKSADGVAHALVRSADPRLCALGWAHMKDDPLAQQNIVEMVRSKDPGVRSAAIFALSEIDAASQPIIDALFDLTRDRDAPDRSNTFRAAVRTGNPRLLREVVGALSGRRWARDASEALTRIPPAALDALEVALQGAPEHGLAWAATALGSVDDPKADALLLRFLEHESSGVRYRTARTLTARRARLDSPLPPMEALERAVRIELTSGYRHCALWVAVKREGPIAAFLAREVESRIRQDEQRLLAVLGWAGGPQLLRLLGQLHLSASQVAKVVEYLENVLPREVATQVVPFFEHPSYERRLEHAAFKVDPVADAYVAIHDQRDVHLWRCAVLTWPERSRRDHFKDVEKELPVLPQLERLRYLRGTALFQDLSPEDLMKVAEVSEIVDMANGRLLFHKGDPGDAMYVIVSGRVAIRDGTTELTQQGPGEPLGELAALDGEPRSADAVCIEPARLLRIGTSELGELMERRPQVARELVRILAQRLRKSSARMAQEAHHPK